jgi:hypothetical protein
MSATTSFLNARRARAEICSNRLVPAGLRHDTKVAPVSARLSNVIRFCTDLYVTRPGPPLWRTGMSPRSLPSLCKRSRR